LEQEKTSRNGLQGVRDKYNERVKALLDEIELNGKAEQGGRKRFVFKTATR
jgi:hypothetical protein